MISGTLSLFNWSLRSDIKSIYPHIIRACFCGFMMLAIIAAWADSLGSMAPGLHFFGWICRLNILLISVSGISYFVTAVTEEKDSGTLALLRLAGVSPLAIVLSKSTSRLISAIMLLLIQLPFTFLAITLGGVTSTQIIAAYLALAAWMCLVGNLALFCSVRCETSGRAASLATAIILLFFAAGPTLNSIAGLTSVPWMPPAVLKAVKDLYAEQQLTSVVVRTNAVLTNAASELVAPQFWRSVTIGGILFGLSVLLFNRYSVVSESVAYGESAAIRRFTIGRSWRFPFVWKDFLFFTGGISSFVTKLLGYTLLLTGFVWFHRLEQTGSSQWLSDDLARKAFLTITILLSVEILLYASNSLFLEQRQAAIASLRMLPVSTPFIFLQKVGAYAIAITPAMLSIIVLALWKPQAIFQSGFSQQFVAWLFFILLAIHLILLMSLYVRWAALPLGLFLTAIASPCILAAAIGLTEITQKSAQLNGISWGNWFGVVVNFVWLWLFVLLPIQIEIVNRWNRLSQE